MSKQKALIFELGGSGRKGFSLPESDVPEQDLKDLLPEEQIREETPGLPEISENEAIRHFIELSIKNHHVDRGFYPLGSCTMKYNPKVNEDIASMPGFTQLHPYQREDHIQGTLEMLYNTEQFINEVTGMDRVTFQPAAGAHGELTGLLVMKAALEAKGEQRTKILCPDSAHGTNPASAAMAGFKLVEIKSNEKGLVDFDDLKANLDEDVAGIMLTNPNTLGLFEEEIMDIAEAVHEVGGLLYYDGANLNAIMGYARPGDMGFDVVHLNLHKTFSAPHGGGGPGSGPIAVKKELEPYLPVPDIKKQGDKFVLDYDVPNTIGKVHGYYGNINVIIKSYSYMRYMGMEGLKQVSSDAVLNANYLREQLKGIYQLDHDQLPCKHEFVISGNKQKKNYGVSTMDIAKRHLDYGVHPSMVYFPLIVDEAMMVEPTETESKESLDEFIDVMKQISQEAESDPETVQNAPYTTPVKRLDEVTAARKPVVRWYPAEE
ncbi:aminomethyl-transferring glycine dehydrogenase subunit GcvPB [Natranaerobius thermophilus]|uniref:Probable glycine dehydrogenase (decarboxylating) subunit 2 n=1 Tax=Natranaerobius thermophilus (strain ATCC BAA-1301 / DSM 18059 / JW/NM-WN-LF) TaxID=457570 RepID=B2A2T1_NATTJ|nr:aminomethyl-transferring glycine dehydrogenase subunit GcvPB [Natranaerobius thermophilus]ACB86299.1 glycine dehydrogenase (decarboxylating) beta subunit [Natranaerobius thermophilus JW/NM-WN-LF]